MVYFYKPVLLLARIRFGQIFWEEKVTGFNKNKIFFFSSCENLETVKICLAASGSYISPALRFLYGLYFQGHLIVHYAIFSSAEKMKGRKEELPTFASRSPSLKFTLYLVYA